MDTRWAVYPLRHNFGSTLSSQCILRRGEPTDVIDVSSGEEGPPEESDDEPAPKKAKPGVKVKSEF